MPRGGLHRFGALLCEHVWGAALLTRQNADVTGAFLESDLGGRK